MLDHMCSKFVNVEMFKSGFGWNRAQKFSFYSSRTENIDIWKICRCFVCRSYILRVIIWHNFSPPCIGSSKYPFPASPRSAHLVTSPSPPSPRPPHHIHLPVSTIRKRKGVESGEGGRGCPANQQKEKWEDLKSARERRRGWTLISWPPGTKNQPKLTQNLTPSSPWARVRDEIGCGAQFEHFILHNLPPLRCWYQGNLAQRHLNCASSDIHETHSWRFLWQ